MTAVPKAVGHSGRIGPNAIIQVGAALRDLAGASKTGHVFAVAQLTAYSNLQPSRMVHEDEVAALQRAVRASLSPSEAEAVLRDAGLRTGEYLLANRIPYAAQAVLKALPASVASYALLAAIRHHAWTFAGSGTFSSQAGNPAVVEIQSCPLCRGETADTPLCGYYAAVFERLFQELVSRRATTAEIACEAMGDPACRFETGW